MNMSGYNKSNSPVTEKVFELLGEGGGLCIIRQKSQTGEKFFYSHNEFVPSDEGLDVNERTEHASFEEPFHLINERYPWYRLHVATVHDDYRDFVINKLIEKLNEKLVQPDHMAHSKPMLEESLKIELTCDFRGNKPVWGHIKIVE